MQTLDGIRIIDMSRGLAGPVATRLLAEQGAEVIKVESPEGDFMRSTAAFASWNRSKMSVVLDRKDARDRETLFSLLATADILVHDLRPSKAKAAGLEASALAQQYPRLIVATVTGYPIDHADADRPGHDILVQARSGAMDEMVGGPEFARYPIPSWAAVYLLATGILARLIIRDRSGRSGPVHTSLLQGALADLTMLWHRAERPTELQASKAPWPRWSPGLEDNIFQCACGGWLYTNPAYADQPMFIVTVAEMGEEPIVIEGFGPTEAQLPIIEKVFRQRTREEWLAELNAGDVPAAPILPLGSVFTDPQALISKYTVELDDPVWGRVRQSSAPFRTSPPSAVRQPAPALGEHRGRVPEWLQHRPRPIVPTDDYPTRYPLEGLKVLDLGMFIAAPFGSQMLGDLGADVIKVEPLGGDRFRPAEGIYLGAARGRRSIALDLGNPTTRPILERLICWADIVHHNQRLPAARRLGVDYDSVKAINPSVIFCHVSAYGPEGQKADWPGYDPVAQAESGWDLESVGPGEKPMWYRLAMMDYQAAMASALATLLGLYRRDRTGEGGASSTSLLGVSVESNSETMLLLESGALAPYPKVVADQTGLSAGYRNYRVANSEWVAVAAIDDARMTAFREVAGVSTDDDLVGALAYEDAHELLSRLDAAGVPAELVRRDQEGPFFDAEVGQPARLAVQYRTKRYGLLEQPGAYWNFGDLGLSLDRAPAAIGEHTREILYEQGYANSDIKDWIESGLAIDAGNP